MPSEITQPSNSEPLVTLSFTEGQRLELTRERPIGIISGPTGSGLTYTLVDGVAPLLANGQHVIRITHVFNSGEDPLWAFLQANKETHQGRYDVYMVRSDQHNSTGLPLFSVFRAFEPAEGALVVIDEPQAVLKDLTEQELAKACAGWGVAILVMVQDASVLDIDPQLVAFHGVASGPGEMTFLPADGRAAESVSWISPDTNTL